MPKRPKQHVIDELAQRVFKDSLPPQWIANPLHSDYAKDFLVEVVQQTDVTGKLFIVQLKGKSDTNPRPCRDRTISVPIKRDHLRHYFEQVRLPVFVVAADIVEKKAYFEFVQAHIANQPGLLAGPPNGTTTFRVSIDNCLDQTSLFLECLESAWSYVKDRYPGSLEAAAKTRKALLENLDPRFVCTVTLEDGKEHIALSARREPVEMSITVSGKSEVVQHKMEAFIGAGQPLLADSEVSLQINGSPLFSPTSGKLASVAFERRAPVELTLFSEHPTHGRVEFPQFRGNLSGGIRECRFKGKLERSPISIYLTLKQKNNLGWHATVHWRWDSSKWIGLNMATLPWLQQVKRFISEVAVPNTLMGITLAASGSVLLDGTVKSKSSQGPEVLLPFIDSVWKASEICKVLGLAACMPEQWEPNDFRDIDELYSLITTGRYECQQREHFNVTLSSIPQEIVGSMESSKPGVIVLHPEHLTYNFLGTTFDFSEVIHEIKDWKEIRVTNTLSNGAPQTELELKNCAKVYVWPRFKPLTEAA